MSLLIAHVVSILLQAPQMVDGAEKLMVWLKTSCSIFPAWRDERTMNECIYDDIH